MIISIILSIQIILNQIDQIFKESFETKKKTYSPTQNNQSKRFIKFYYF